MKLNSLLCVFFLLIIVINQSNGQQYHATHGSPYAGAVSIFNNPASSVNSLYKWDLNLFSLQTTLTTNNLSLNNFSYLHPGNTTLSIKEGSNNYFAHQNLDFNFFNFLYKPDEKHAFTIGLRGRTYNHNKSSPMYASDTITSGYSFLRANRSTAFLDGFSTHTAWVELNLNYSQVLFETDRTRLTGGITLNIAKALSGYSLKLNRVSFKEYTIGTDTGYLFTNGGIEYSYTNNYDLTTASTAKDVLKNSRSGLGLNLGLEYLIYDEASTDNNAHTPTNYNWKLGFSIMDLGKNKFNNSPYTGNFYNPIPNINNAVVTRKLTNIKSIPELKDSLKTFFNNYDSLSNTFSISRPTRIIFNVDKNLGNHFAVNGQLNINLYSTSNYRKLLTRETNLITITPRWETITWGLYIPVQYNTQGQLWVGAAIKLGPLTMGLHNIRWLKTIHSINGGGYILLSIHPFNRTKVLSRFDCPE
ncbi:MAG: hypothetical protein K2Q21_01690 [Chitinophagaceae bacterium]|nr:hypothetical protein [Chitinophagaceae bacterium]